jgi:hypothetical protein
MKDENTLAFFDQKFLAQKFFLMSLAFGPNVMKHFTDVNYEFS